jgi:TolB-like protein/class 3 adenylate cyclase/tetratricopeptide (TPR) repeat protein
MSTGTGGRVERRLAAILAADIAGYSRLMGIDEEGTLAQVKSCRATIIYPKVEEYRGRIVKTTGDGALVEFPSTVEAVRCAVEIQRGMSARNTHITPDKRIEIRIGINVGDIIIDDGDIYGDGVNVAARLEAIAAPGSLCISGEVHRQVRGKLEVEFEDGGEQNLKNIAEPVQVFRLRSLRSTTPSSTTGSITGSTMSSLPPLPNKASIAVLPFDNLSGDPEQAYFADGMVEEIITGLAKTSWLFVVARNSSFIYKGKAVDVKQVGRDLGVRYVLEGSVRKAGGRVRITGQLIDAASGAHLWADRFDGMLEDIFDLQDKVTATVVGAIEPAMRNAEIQQAQRKPTSSLDAYDWFLRALSKFNLPYTSRYEDALVLCRHAIAADPNYAAAHALAAWACAGMYFKASPADGKTLMQEGAELARNALEFAAADPIALAIGGQALNFLSVKDRDRALQAAQRAISLAPNSAQVWLSCGHVHQMRGEGDAAIEHFERALRLSPRDPFGWAVKGGLAVGHFIEGRLPEATDWAEKALHDNPTFYLPLWIKIAGSAHLGRMEQAQEALRATLELYPETSISKWELTMRTVQAPSIDSYIEGFRKAGMPE